MIALDEMQAAELATICRRRSVSRLELFGSAARDDFDAVKSDLDFIVEFHELSTGEHADAYFGLLEDLQELFGRKVDLVMDRAVKNRYFRQAIQRDRTVVYAA